MPTVSRRDRLVDVAALVLILLGIALFLSAMSRFGEIGKLSYRHPGPPSVSALRSADRARYMALSGAGFIVIGGVVAAAGAIRVARRRAPAPR